ncbi:MULTISPECIES: monovalent cation/H+ antiporter complex subunit F [Corynebacterium]|uniref:monovalent cation/H+ antiporter complex subunit F n=1 Tax=Corynebacterium TaxID=1716 RepID=UPI00066819F5|nr:MULTISPECIES: monovalent cation/H+ antiporter complex subunit F [Corynebacterium]MDU4704427.1 monovalent cation/H+ antiporter complex subunit F [Corynebacterium sp.]MBC6762858.1 cation:proton antiporter [Corynebacterium sp. LK27]MCT1548443.1 monovalent cation/H+ antiporter complex subunit F [Corynebacterium amycolatum]MDK8809374.1 monovalent cation/H+ antiporter complex subunit F [Corynebacterium sp. MSK035]MDK8827254.1 monovalent cation/H+ antiporter complex subunit F [Corynebacterium sp. 
MNPEVFNILLGVAAAGYFIAVMITLGHMIAGPNSLDRLVALESMTAMLQGMLAAFMAWSLDTSVVYPMLIIALLGFLSSLAVAKFRVPDDGKQPAKGSRKGVAKAAGKVATKKTAQKAAPKATPTAAPKTVKGEPK